ncbi:ABC transporter substrate-binding protein, partial [Alphaproteobacteria bacterium]|nr:ABC transporter substrate-binding protein [Alphaproteobacteria bacterium]
IDPNNIELPKESHTYEELLDDHPFLKEIARKFLNKDLYKEVRYKDLRDQDKKNLIAVYLGMCAEVDHNIGRILASLEKNKLDKNTLIVFTSDHGELLGENRMWGKLGWWDSAYRIPLIVYNPGEKNYEVNDFTESVDLALVFSAGTVLWSVTSYADGHCEGSTMSDGHTGGKYPQQYELSEYQSAAGCKMMFSENPNIVSINDTIQGNKGLAAVADRLPDEPLVVVPYDSVGSYGGTIRFLSNATEAGTSDMLSTRHVNLVRFADDLSTIVPNVAKDYEWNDDFTTLTFMLRKGHKWSNGEPFTARDVEFWYEDLMMNTNIREKPYPYLLVGGEPMTVDVVDDTTVRFNLPSPFPGLLATLAWSYNQAFMPAHFLEQFHPEIDSNADANAQALGFENGWDALAAYYGNSGWTDTPTPMLRNPDLVAGLEYAAYPSLEAYMTIEDTTEGRVYAANPYFHQVDTAGNQLPYIDYQNERYINENEIRLLKLVNGEVDYKSQSVQLESAPQLLDGAESGGYSLQINPGCGAALFSFNVTHPDMEKRKVYSDIRFRQAMSIALDRNEINDVAYYGMGVVEQFVGISPAPDFVPDAIKMHMTQYDPDGANALLDEVGLKDVDGDGFRELPNGAAFAMNIDYATQGIGGVEVELVARMWNDVGVKTNFKEVTPDEYRGSQSSNALDVHAWDKGQPLAIIAGNPETFKAPFGNYFNHTQGMLWAAYIDSNGSDGVEPPQWVYDLSDGIDKFQSYELGTAESNEWGEKITTMLTEQTLLIGTVKAPFPTYHRNALKNFTQFKTT